ncbi:hypothetical protein BST61_g1614 [Cercospora zeina]
MHFAVVGLAVVALTTTATVLIPPPTPGLNCALCLDDLNSLTGCGRRPDKPHFDPECLCSPENAKFASNCNNSCKGVRFAKDITCIWSNEVAKQEHSITARGPYGCAICLQDAERKVGCVDDPSNPNFNFDCLCQEPGFSTNVKDCNLFCADTPLNLDNQCPKPTPAPFAEREVADNDPRPAPSPALPVTALITPRGTIGNPKQTVDPHFGFCGPKGSNCKSTVRAPPAAEKYHYGYDSGNNVFDNNPYGPPRPTITPLPKGSVPHHGNPSTMQRASGRFGFCGPSGSNCRVGDAEHSSSSALALPMIMAVSGPSGVVNVTTIITTPAGDANPTVTHTHIHWEAQDSMHSATATPTPGLQQGSAGLDVSKNVAEILLGAVAIAALV